MEEQIHVGRNIHWYHGTSYFINRAPSMEEINPIMRGFYTGRNIWNNGYGFLPYNNNFLQPSWRGLVVPMAMDCLDCQYLQAVIEEGDPRYIARILFEIKDDLHELMKHQFGNYLIQKIFEANTGISNIQIDSIVYLIISSTQFSDVCKNNHGTRVVQIMVENIKCPVTKYAVLYKMKPIIVELMKNINGGYVIVQCVKVFPPALKKVILDELAKHCVDIATHKIGCSVLQICLKDSEILAMDLITAIISNAMFLAEDPYGNYVVQFIIKMEFPFVNERMIAQLYGKFARLSMNKHASNVVEDLMRCSNQDDVDAIVEELIRSNNFLNVIQDPYGNYVAQRALKCTQKEGLSHSAEAVDNSLQLVLDKEPRNSVHVIPLMGGKYFVESDPSWGAMEVDQILLVPMDDIIIGGCSELIEEEFLHCLNMKLIENFFSTLIE
ncbi:pumilio homolog 12-like [Vicia villosa]|uniref:pumilio homolog 12-like n=1 Tax=Vicia villosa TaxID=3911 RepID=UPI00273ADC6D|nr:pumilio homolog 12-like [Vicia villosa]